MDVGLDIGATSSYDQRTPHSSSLFRLFSKAGTSSISCCISNTTRSCDQSLLHQRSIPGNLEFLNETLQFAKLVSFRHKATLVDLCDSQPAREDLIQYTLLVRQVTVLRNTRKVYVREGCMYIHTNVLEQCPYVCGICGEWCSLLEVSSEAWFGCPTGCLLGGCLTLVEVTSRGSCYFAMLSAYH